MIVNDQTGSQIRTRYKDFIKLVQVVARSSLKTHKAMAYNNHISKR